VSGFRVGGIFLGESHPLHPVRAPAPDGPLDRLVWYIYSNFKELLTEQEYDLYTLWVSSRKLMHHDPAHAAGSMAHERASEIGVRFPELIELVNRDGYVAVMMAAAERVVRDHPDRKILLHCGRCGALCRTPKSQQCFDCGYDWHPAEPR
jgi:hypothetical protein